MYQLLLISLPILCVAFGIFPVLAASILAVVMSLLSAIRYFAFAMVLMGRWTIVGSSDIEMIKTQWAISLAMIIGTVVLWQSQFLFAFWFSALIIGPALWTQWRMTYLTLTNQGNPTEDA